MVTDPEAKLAARRIELTEPGVGATGGEVVRYALATSVDRFCRNEPGVAAGEDPEAVHQARVATRRLRSDLRTFASLVDPGWAGELRAELAWLAGLLGGIRDADVLSMRLRERVSALP
ncbi:MAG: CHAD domain-containing protein, partial [Actinomycetota bacterium]